MRMNNPHLFSSRPFLRSPTLAAFNDTESGSLVTVPTVERWSPKSLEATLRAASFVSGRQLARRTAELASAFVFNSVDRRPGS